MLPRGAAACRALQACDARALLPAKHTSPACSQPRSLSAALAHASSARPACAGQGHKCGCRGAGGAAAAPPGAVLEPERHRRAAGGALGALHTPGGPQPQRLQGRGRRGRGGRRARLRAAHARRPHPVRDHVCADAAPLPAPPRCNHALPREPATGSSAAPSVVGPCMASRRGR